MFPLRDENPTHSAPVVTVALILINIGAYLFQVTHGVREMIVSFGIIPLEIAHNANLPTSTGVSPYFTLLTSMFLHGGIGHLLGNLWFLWIFGDNLEDFFGKFWFILFYLLTGLAAGLTHVFLNSDSTIPTIGASGAVSGVLGAYLILFPKIRIRTLMVLGFFIDVIYVPAVFFLGIWLVMQLLGGLGSGSGIAFGAHIGGFVAGVLFVLLCSRKESFHPHRYDPWRQRRF